MGYYMRFILTDNKRPSFEEMQKGLHLVNPLYKIEAADLEDNALLYYNDHLLGEIELNHPGDGIFEDDIEELVQLVGGAESTNGERILAALRAAKALVAVRAVWQGHDSEWTLKKIDPLWDWLFEHHEGLLQADNEGIYEANELLLPLDLKL